MTMALTDTHAHLDGIGDAAAIAAAVARAAAAGVTRILAVGGNPDGNAVAAASAASLPGVWAAVGFDRYCATRTDLPDALLAEQLAGPRVAALGEIGLDFHHEPGTADAQEALFVRMLDLAAERRLPAVIHCRDAEARMLPLLRRHAERWPGEPARIGVIHCFTGTADFARAVLGLGFHISYSGILTFTRADNVRAAAAATPPERLLVETDSPYLTPVPHRGRPNEPMFVGLVAEGLANVKGMPADEMAAITHANAGRLFGLGD